MLVLFIYNQSRMTLNSYLGTAEKAGIQGAVTGAATCLYYGMNAVARVPFIGDTKLCYVAACVGVATSVADDLIHKFVKEEVQISKKAEDEASMVIGAGAGAAMYHLSLTAINPALAKDTGLLMNACIGGGSELAGSFIYNLIRG